ncbi:MAG: DHH family phosphoesterase [Oscillospiraceae bacterium]|jgi:c-di-AMP phosphodiesterase-like protein
MNKKVQKFIGSGMKLYLPITVLFAAVTVLLNWKIAVVEFGLILATVIYSTFLSKKGRKDLLNYIESVTYDTESARNSTLMHFPLPIVVFKLDDFQIVWGNAVFFDLCGTKKSTLEAYVTDFVPDFTSKWIIDGQSCCPELLHFGGRKYQLHGNIIHPEEARNSSNHMGITYWVDVTEYDDTKIEYDNTRPVAGIIVLDNFDELTRNVTDKVRNGLRGDISDKISQWFDDKDGYIRRFDSTRYMFIMEERYLPDMIQDKFSLLRSVHDVINPRGIHATVSIGVGHDGSGFAENFRFAELSIEMALSRGGDQAVVKDHLKFEFYGGRGSEIETRTRVKSRVVANAFNELIRDASQTFVMGHKHSDLDSVGAAVGVCCIARKLGKQTHIIVDLQNNAASRLIQNMQTLPEYAGVFLSPEEAMLKTDSQSLLVVVDTNRPEQVVEENLLLSCNRVAVIDHHRRAATYIEHADLTLYEPYASSVCELMTELLQELVEQSDIMREEAEAILSGIIMDTKSFSVRTGERTFDAAAFLRRAGADTTEVKRLLQNDLDTTVERYRILQKAKLYHKSIAIAVPETPHSRVVAAQAADELLNISGVEASFVVCPTEEGGVAMSARSIGDINVQVLLESLGGGGNKSVAGAQLKNIGIQDAVSKLFAAIDSYMEE